MNSAEMTAAITDAEDLAQILARGLREKHTESVLAAVEQLMLEPHLFPARALVTRAFLNCVRQLVKSEYAETMCEQLARSIEDAWFDA